MKAGELLKLSEEEANTKLDDKEFERWQELHKAKEKKDDIVKEREKKHSDAIETLTDSFKKDELTETIEVSGEKLTIILTMNREQIEMFKNMQKYNDMSFDNLEDMDGIEQEFAKFLDSVVKEHDYNDWMYFADEVGVRGLAKFVEKVVEPIKEKGDSVKDFRD